MQSTWENRGWQGVKDTTKSTASSGMYLGLAVGVGISAIQYSLPLVGMSAHGYWLV